MIDLDKRVTEWSLVTRGVPISEIEKAFDQAGFLVEVGDPNVIVVSKLP